MAMIEAAFHRTPFAKPHVTSQPPGGRTLIRTDNWFAMNWTTNGYQPEEVDTLNPTDWFGLTVRIKPTLNTITYTFGDGTSHGPTTSLGGPYPTGDIIKAYTTQGTYNTTATVTLTGQVSLNNSEWIDIPGEAHIDGPPTTLTVLTAKNRLHLPGG